jgi:superfamily II DNA/RNA helicase
MFISGPANASSLMQTSQMLEFHGHKIVVLSGLETATNREKTMKEFFTSPTARILLVSSVALNGLNLQHACILIVLVSYFAHRALQSYSLTSEQDIPWSAQEVQQLIGRLVRRGQLKVAIVYFIVASGTTDIALNNISSDKRALLTGWKATDQSLS